ncbi:MAG: hypothetical protein Q8P61_02470, partial [Candidatus Nanopelagicales bacterium]|nr:hypothetical protein [Candidatus Nanopelagicales bacterium]
MEDKPDLAAETLAAVRLASRGQSHRRSGSRRRFAVTDPTYTGSGPDSRDPQLVEEGVADLVNERGWQERVRVASIIGRWPEIAGSQ